MDKKTLNCPMYQEHRSLIQLYQEHLHGLTSHNNHPLTTTPRTIELILKDNNNKVEGYITSIVAYKLKKKYQIEIGTYCNGSRTIQISKNLHNTAIMLL